MNIFSEQNCLTAWNLPSSCLSLSLSLALSSPDREIYDQVCQEHKHGLTLRGLGAYIFLDQGICGLSVKAEGVFQGLEIGALFQEGFLQTVSTRMEILLNEKTKTLVTESVKHAACSYRSLIHNSLNLNNHPFIETELIIHIKYKFSAVTVGSNSGMFAAGLLLSSTFYVFIYWIILNSTFKDGNHS